MRSVRVFFSKKGDIKYISHLDLNRFMLKIIRMSKIPVWYSEGFNPHPYITFALPLSLGFESEYEIMDLRLDDDSFTNEQVLSSLKPLFPNGLELFGCKDPVMKAGQVAFADYKIEFDLLDVNYMNGINNLLDSDEIIAKKKTKKGTYKDIDLKEYIKSYSVNDNTLLLTLAAGGSNNLNPKLIIDAFKEHSGFETPYYKVTRTMLYNENMEEFI